MDAFECNEGTALCVEDASGSAAFMVLGPVSKAKGVDVACEHLRQEGLCDFLYSKLMVLLYAFPCDTTLDPAFANEYIMLQLRSEEVKQQSAGLIDSPPVPTPGGT